MQKKEIIFFHSCAECSRVERDAQTDETLNLEAVYVKQTMNVKFLSWLALRPKRDVVYLG
jgi:hypothetical protein